MHRRFELAHVIVFAAFLLAWTIALELPVPHESAQKVLGGPLEEFFFGKGLHICAYAFLTVLGGTVAIFGRRWWWVLPGLVAHGGITEFFQQFTGRTARIEDVGLDTIGVALGSLLIFAWRRFTKSKAESSSLESGDDRDSSPPRPLPTNSSTTPTRADSH